MLLWEFFQSGDMVADLRQQVLDYLTPLVVHGVDFVTVQDVQDALRNHKTGLSIDRGLVMQVLDPDKIAMVKKIEGDKVYLNIVAAINDGNKSGKDEQEKAEEKLSNKATQQAKKQLKKK